MMNPDTVEQLLQVLRQFRDSHASGVPLRTAYREAVPSVAKAYSVSYRTIGDACRRRLRLDDVNKLYALLASWVKGDASGLARQLKDNADSSAHGQIDDFFAGVPAAAETPSVTVSAKASPEPETISFQLPPHDARMLRALAELEGISVRELAACTVSTAVRARMAAVARGIIKDAEAQG